MIPTMTLIGSKIVRMGYFIKIIIRSNLLMKALCFSLLIALVGNADGIAADISRGEAERLIEAGVATLRSAPPAEALADWTGELVADKPRFGTLPIRDKTMPFAVVAKGDATAETGRTLFICMHGGGQDANQTGPHTWGVNSREFETQVAFAARLYEPDGVYFIPRMADDRLGRWWHAHNQVALDRVIDHAILHWGVDPNRVYLLGVSEGGYGTDILAPFMADRWAGAGAMAAGVGLANPPANLRNVAFRTDVGEADLMFDRMPMAKAFHEELDRLRDLDPAGYNHSINVQPGRGHGIDYRQGIVWIEKHRRDPWPRRVVWVNQTLDGVRRERFYWLAMPEIADAGDFLVDASADKTENTITIEAFKLQGTNRDGNRTHGVDHVAQSPRESAAGHRIDLLLNDRWIDLDRPIKVVCNGLTVFEGTVKRDADLITRELTKRPDAETCPSARLTITVP